MKRSRKWQAILMCLALIASFSSAAFGAIQFQYQVPWTVSDIQEVASDLPPPPPSPDCYAPTNVGVVGAWHGCDGLLIVEGGNGTYGIGRALRDGITVDGVTYGATNIFTGQITSMAGIFENAGSFNEDIGYWDTSRVTNFSSMFREAYNFNQDISGWDTSSAVYMRLMFRQAFAFNADISGWDVSSVTDMTQMFFSIPSFNQPIGNWDTSSLYYANFMFTNTGAFNQDLSNWDMTSVIGMDGMFRDSSAFNQDLTGWCTTNLTSSPPTNFNARSVLQPANLPIWGTCP